MDARIKKLWTAALRSGEYKQGRMQLECDDGSMCCLMVLCKIAEAEGIVRIENGNAIAVTNEADRSHIVLPEAVMEWAGLQSTTGKYQSTNEDGEVFDEELTEDNDNQGKSFDEIADIIDAKL